MEEWNVFRGISQSTTDLGVTPGLGLRLIELLLRFRATGLPSASTAIVAWEPVLAAGGGGLLVPVRPGLWSGDEVTEKPSSSSPMVGSVGRPL